MGNRTTWAMRIERSAELARRNPWAKEVLDLYGRILEFQKTIYEARDNACIDNQIEFRCALDLNEAERSIPDLLRLAQSYGPSKLAAEATRLQNVPISELRGKLNQFLAEPDSPDAGGVFFVRILLQPLAERMAQARGPKAHAVAGNRCPQCSSAPQLAVIRPEGDGGKRMLLCSLCQSEWEFRRILCPYCGEENHEKLPRYTADGIPAVRVEACDTCKRYLKSVDLTIDGLAVPVVDEVATAPLDLWAAEHDYTKIQSNLMGF